LDISTIGGDGGLGVGAVVVDVGAVGVGLEGEIGYVYTISSLS